MRLTTPLTNVLLLLSSFFITKALTQDSPFAWDQVSPSNQLDWTPCFATLQCARFKVPLNYTDPTAGDAVLALTRIPSKLSPDDERYRGPLLFNPGGPGVSGTEFVAGGAATPLADLLPEFDIVGVDPRGVAHSSPQITLFRSDVENALWDIHDPNVNSLNGTGSIADGITRLWGQAQILGQLVKDNDVNGSLPYITTDNMARDMMRIVEAHGRTDINFYGLSYGTALGATLAAMFPDRIERMILDGVFETNGYYDGDWSAQFVRADKALQLFFDSCFSAGPSRCAFHAGASSPTAIKDSLFQLLESVRINPVPVYQGPDKPYGIIDYAGLKSTIVAVIRDPYSRFPAFAEGLAALKEGNGTGIFAFLNIEDFSGTNHAAVSPLNAPPTISDERKAELAIVCNDMREIRDTPRELVEYFDSVSHISVFMDALIPKRTWCSGWKIHPEHFTGPITGNTSFPILFIANTADPVTPPEAAISTSERFPGSVVSIQDSGSHTSLAGAVNKCQLQRISSYMHNGTLPDPDEICQMDIGLFEPPEEAVAKRRVDGRSTGRGRVIKRSKITSMLK